MVQGGSRAAAGATPAWSAVLRALREAQGVTQDGWATYLGYSRSTIRRWESGSTVPDAAAEAALIAHCREKGLFRAFERGPLAGVTLTPEALQQLLAEARLGAVPETPGAAVAPATAHGLSGPVGAIEREPEVHRGDQAETTIASGQSVAVPDAAAVHRRRLPRLLAGALAALVIALAAVGGLAVVVLTGGGQSHAKRAATITSTAAPALLIDTMTDPEQGLLPRSAAFAEFPGYTLGYQNGEYVWKSDSGGGNAQPPIPFAGDYADVALAVDVRVGGDTADRTFGLGCRTPGYYARIDVGAGMFTVEEYVPGEPSAAGRQSSIPLVDWQSTSAIRQGNGFNTIALRCVGSTVALAINHIEVTSITDTTYSHGALFLGMGGRGTNPVGMEAHLRNLVIASLDDQNASASSPLRTAGWPAALALAAPPPGSPVPSDLRVYDNATAKHEGEFPVAGGVVACFSLAPGKLTAPLTIVASDASGPRPRDATDAVVIARSAPVPSRAGARCVPVPLLKQLAPLHTYRVEVVANGTRLASKSFSNAPAAADVLFADDLSSVQTGKLAVRSGLGAFPDLRESYENGAFVVRNTFAGQQIIEPYTFMPDTYADAALAVDVRLSGASAGQHVYLACRAGQTGAYILDVVPAFGLAGLFRQDITDQPRRIPLLALEPYPAVNRGNELNHIVLRCAGSTISAAINGREVLALNDTTFTSGLFGFTAMGAAGNASVEADFSNLVVAKQ